MRNIFIFLITLMLVGCNSMGSAKTEAKYPKESERVQDEKFGKLFGDDTFTFFGSKKGMKKDSSSGITVNGYLWRATLDTLSFMPIVSADPFGGVILTDWYEDPKTPEERFKVNAFITNNALRADAIKITVFKQKLKSGEWRDVDVKDRLGRDLEDTVLTRARQLRVSHHS